MKHYNIMTSSLQSPLMITLHERGFIKDATDLEGLDRLAAREPITAYIGFDLTASSLHVGSMIQLMALRHLKAHGHNPILLFGEATTRIGDPSDKNGLRPILSPDVILENRHGITRVVDRFLGALPHVSNLEWLENLSFMDFLQGPAREFTLNRMLTMDIVSKRLEAQKPLTIMELCYSMMQAMDFKELAKRRNVCLQIGGSDQWSNIIAGLELIRKSKDIDTDAFGLTTPLMLDPQGRKMGKTADGQAIWLDPRKVSSFDLWQFWRNTPDEKVAEFLGLFTELPMEQVRDLTSQSGSALNDAKIALANEAVAIAHGREASSAAEASAAKAFSGQQAVDLPSITLTADEVNSQPSIADVAVKSGLTPSKKEAKRLAQQGGLKINGQPISNADQPFELGSTNECVMSAGKKRFINIKGKTQ